MPGLWAAAHPGEERVFSPSTMPAFRCRVPQQENGYDCALFVLNHIEFFLHGASELALASEAREERWQGSLTTLEQAQGGGQQAAAAAAVAVGSLHPGAAPQGSAASGLQAPAPAADGGQQAAAPPAAAGPATAAAAPAAPAYPPFLAINLEVVQDEQAVVGPALGFLRRGWFSSHNAAALRGELVHLMQERMLTQALDK